MTIDVRGQSIHYEEAGAGEVVLLLHGWGTDLTLFRPLMELLARKYRVVAIDFPGFGQSPEPTAAATAAAWCVDDYADCVLAFLQAMDIKACSMLGHSFGGRVIIKLAARDLPELKLQKLILTGAAGIKHPQSVEAQKRAKKYQTGKQLLAPFPKLLERYRNKHGSADYRAASPMMRQVLVKTVNEDLSPLLPQVAPPPLLIWGRNDTATPLEDGQRMEAEIPGAGLAVIENAGHYAFLEQQAQFLRIIASFMQIGD